MGEQDFRDYLHQQVRLQQAHLANVVAAGLLFAVGLAVVVICTVKAVS